MEKDFTSRSNVPRKSEKTMPSKEKQFSHKTTSLTRTLFTLISVALFFLIVVSLPSHCASAKSSEQGRRRRNICRVQTSEWSECTKACDMGTSERVRTRRRCKLKRESRLCMIRSCDKAFFSPKIKKGGKSCLRHTKPKKEFLTYAGATSVRKYKMKYCGWCTDTNRCCTPTKSRTRKVWFKTKNGKRYFKKMSFIRRCHCHGNCRPISGKMVPTIDLLNDMHRGPPEGGENDLPNEVQRSKSHTTKRRKKRPKKNVLDST